MKKALSIIITSMLCLSLSAQVTQTFNVKSFNAIRASHAFNITLSIGKTESVVIEADKDLMPLVRVENDGGTLRIYIDENINMKNNMVLNAYIEVKDLNKINLSGACKLVGQDVFSAQSFDLKLSGASSADLSLKVKSLKTSISGASSLNLRADVASSDYSASGASHMTVRIVNGQDATFKLSGASQALISGRCDNTKYTISGASSVKASDLKALIAECNVSGSSTLSVNATGQVFGRASGAGKVYYEGKPEHVSLKTSGAGTFISR